MLRKLIFVAVLVAFTPGCSTVKGWFGSSTKSKVNQPTELVKIASPVGVNKLWDVSLGKGEGRLWLRQRPAVNGGRVYATNDDGEVLALDAATGKQIWVANAVNVEKTGSWVKFWKRKAAEAGLTGSPGVGNGLVVVGGRNGEVIAFSADTGEKRWATRVSSEVLSAPYITDTRVIVRSNDGRVFGFDPADGTRKWVFDRGLPSLSVRGNASPVGSNGMTFIGYDDGKLVALRDLDGLLVWELAVAEPDGRTELERMADIDGEIIIDGEMLYVTSYHDKVMALSLQNGQQLWTNDTGSYAGLAVASDKVLLSDKTGNVWALDRNNGTSLWKQNVLGNRQLTSPVVHGDYAVVGDLEGYLHWIKLDTGDVAGRARIERAAVRGTPQVSAEGVLYALSNEGELAAYRLGN
ncbi:MAG: outer membrane protein assembly factor BamB [Gammaproteobacteria bacterium RIFCSPHIGHO2_12_FULL_63_22]|nr:MAG: outer membrane protein assembly factor BamB [Gammaproteobacteria bacterium RIFCSPHIGHO2_12_FULL_63_22]